jgi:hypothetical protein
MRSVFTSIDTVSVVRVNNEYKTLGILVVVSPQGSDFVLSSNIPHGEANVLVFHGLHVESYAQTG